MSGFGEVLQHTPLAVTVAPPSEITFPPLVAVVCVISVTGDVDTVGAVGVAAGSIAKVYVSLDTGESKRQLA
jgi:hypothetical protein